MSSSSGSWGDGSRSRGGNTEPVEWQVSKGNLDLPSEGLSSSVGCSSSSAESSGILLPIESLPIACTRAEISDAEGRRLVTCVPVPEADVESGRFEAACAIARDGNLYQCRWTEGARLEGPLVIRYFDGDNLLEIVNTEAAVQRWRVFTYEPYETDEPEATGPNRVERYIIRDEEGRLEGIRRDTYRDGLPVHSIMAWPHASWSETQYSENGRIRTTGWPETLPFSCSSAEVTRVAVEDSAGRLLVECQPVSEAEVLAELHRMSVVRSSAFVARARDGGWYRGDRHDDLPFGESLIVRIYSGERLLSVESVIVRG